ncbi:MAG: hypothetical protein HDR23_09240, partial [Lachnospiraceae bacterium]|nr:hypothetical protein [Lachnospiraceae bacterium]
NEEELRQILEQYKEWIIKYGLSFLDEISKPTTEARPKPETSLYLYQNHEEIYERYQKKWQLTDGKETIHILKEKMETLFDKDFAEIEQTLIEYAAVYGHAMCIGGEGEWVWEKITNTCVLINAGGVKCEYDPLKDVISSYGSKSDVLECRYNNLTLYRNHALELRAKAKKAKEK